jgi:L-lysine exporter family protein LysE/ArgO
MNWTWTAFPAGFAACALLIVAIGAQNAFVLRQALRDQHVVAIVIACVLADALLISVGVVGFGRVVTAYPWALEAARWLGAAFLLGYGLRALARARVSHGLVAAGAPGAGDASASLRGTLTTLAALTFLNPHVYLDTIVLLGALGSAQPLAGRAPFALGAIAASLTWFVMLGFGGRLLAGCFASPRAWRYLDLGLGSVTVLLAVGMVVG